jgi:hypothetical protein
MCGLPLARLRLCSIAARHEDEWEGGTLARGQRVSLTLRRMAADVHVLSHPAPPPPPPP